MSVRTLSFAVAVVCVPLSASGQAWTRDQGSFYAGLSITTMAGNAFHGADFESIPLASTYRQLSVGLYAEVGLVDRYLTATLSSEVFRRNQLDGAGRTLGLGDSRIGLWTGLLTSPLKLAVGVVADVPTGDEAPDSAAARSLPTGNGKFDVTPTVAVGHSFGGQSWPLTHFAQLVVGYSPAVSGFAQQLSYRLELGSRVPLDVLDRFWLTLRLSGTESFASNQDLDPSLLSGLGNGVSVTALGLELYGRIAGGFGATLGADTAFRARGIVSALPIKVGLSYQR
ncbi:MAG: hypothetical protein HY791_07270 [Deltaproteobacteria bacterium]|nr:hypothetical protein [Deltaproteobacteria bacterium]